MEFWAHRAAEWLIQSDGLLCPFLRCLYLQVYPFSWSAGPDIYPSKACINSPWCQGREVKYKSAFHTIKQDSYRCRCSSREIAFLSRFFFNQWTVAVGPEWHAWAKLPWIYLPSWWQDKDVNFSDIGILKKPWVDRFSRGIKLKRVKLTAGNILVLS